MDKILGAENTDEEVKRGQSFGLWARNGLAKRNLKINDLHIATKISKSYLGVLINSDGVKPTTRKYQRPGEDKVRKIAQALNISEDEGRQAAGYAPLPPPLPAPTPTQRVHFSDGYVLFYEPLGKDIEVTDELLQMLGLTPKAHKQGRQAI